MSLSEAQLLGLDDGHVEQGADGHSLHPDCRAAFERLQKRGREAGFDLQLASGFRSFERQLQIWNAKASGQRPLLDEQDRALDPARLSSQQLLEAILRFSALPGTSRHHWGSDCDVFDAAAVPKDYRVQLNSAEVSAGGLFAPLHEWLDQLIANDDCEDFIDPTGWIAAASPPSAGT